MGFDLAATVARLRRQGSDDALVEAKSAAKTLGKSAWESISAFANTSGGVLLLGLSEQDGFVPVDGFALDVVRDQLVDGLGDGNVTGARLVNPPRYRVERGEVDGRPVLVVHVDENAPTAKPCYIKAKGVHGGSYRRVDDKDVLLTPAEIFELQNVNTVSAVDREAVPEATLDDLDPHRIDALVAAHHGGKALAGAVDQQARMRRLNVIDAAGGVRLAALLVLGYYPQQFFPRLLVDVTVHPTIAKSAAHVQLRFEDRVECTGPLADMVDEAMVAVRRNLRHHTVVEGAGRRDELEIPEVVLREAIANAVLHREYHPPFDGQPVAVDIYPDRVEVTSPGGLWGGKTIENLDDGQSRCRNQTLMQLLQRVPLSSGAGTVAEGQGSGIAQMNSLMASRALDRPDYGRTTLDHVRVILRRHGAESTEMRHWVERSLGGEASVEDETAVVIAKRDGVVSVASLRAASGRDSDDARAVLRGLAQRGVLRVYGPEEYVLDDAPATPRGTDLEVLNLLSVTEPTSVADLAEITGRSVGSLRPVLRRLVASGRVVATAPPTSRHRRYLRAETPGAITDAQ